MIPLCIPDISDDEINAVKEVLRSGWLAHGIWNERFESNFADYIGTKHAVSLNSCTSALHLALQASDIRGEVITPSFTWIATANSIINAGATPVFSDVDYDTCNIDASLIEAQITPRTEALLIVHYGGLCCDMDELLTIADKHNLLVIEDSAETIGGEIAKKKAGSFGIGCFSFFPTKNITTGEGGMLTTNDDQLARKVRALAAHGLDSTTLDRSHTDKPWIRNAKYSGYNFRMSNILAAIGYHQLKRIDFMNQCRINNATMFTDRFKSSPYLDCPVVPTNFKHVYQMYTLKILNDKRDQLVSSLIDNGISASVHFSPPAHKHEVFSNHYRHLTLPVTERLSKRILTLPMFPQLTENQIEEIASTVLMLCASLNSNSVYN